MDNIFSLCFKIENFMPGQNSEINQNIMESLLISIENTPYMAVQHGELIIRYAEKNSNFLEKIKKKLMSVPKDNICDISFLIYGSLLGAETPFNTISNTIKPLGTILNDLKIFPHNKEFFNMITEKFINLRSEADFSSFYCYSIIKRFEFSFQEAIVRLHKFSVESILNGYLIEQELEDISFLISTCRTAGFMTALLQNIEKFKYRKHILGYLFLLYYKIPHTREITSRTTFSIEDFRLFKKKIYPDEIEYIKMLANPIEFSVAFDRDINGNMTSEDILDINTIENIKDKKLFYRNILIYSSKSPAKLLGYVEKNIEKFSMDKEEINYFIDTLKEIHPENQMYIKIILEKLRKYGILKS